MEQQLTDRIVEILEGRLPAGAELSMAGVLAARLPAGVRAWMAGAIAWQRAEELGAQFARPTAGGTAERIAHAVVISQVPQYRIGRDDLLGLLREAVAFVEAYLRRPRRMLEWLLLAEAERVTVPEIASRLDMVTEYRYLGVVLLRLLARRREVERREVRRLIARADDAVVRTHGPVELARLMGPLFSWYALAGMAGVPREAVRDFLDDKKMEALRDYIEAAVRFKGETTMTAGEISTFAGDLVRSSGPQEWFAPVKADPSRDLRSLSEAGPSKSAEASPSRDLRSLSEAGPSKSAEAPQGQASDAPNPEGARGRAPKGQAGPLTSAVFDSFKENIRRNFALSLTSAGMKVGTAAKPPLLSIFTGDQRAVFASTLFKNDSDEFTRTVGAVAGLPSWIEAARYLTDVLESRQLNPFDKDAIEFTGIVREWFLGKEELP